MMIINMIFCRCPLKSSTIRKSTGSGVCPQFLSFVILMKRTLHPLVVRYLTASQTTAICNAASNFPSFLPDTLLIPLPLSPCLFLSLTLNSSSFLWFSCVAFDFEQQHLAQGFSKSRLRSASGPHSKSVRTRPVSCVMIAKLFFFDCSTNS